MAIIKQGFEGGSNGATIPNGTSIGSFITTTGDWFGSGSYMGYSSTQKHTGSLSISVADSGYGTISGVYPASQIYSYARAYFYFPAYPGSSQNFTVISTQVPDGYAAGYFGARIAGNGSFDLLYTTTWDGSFGGGTLITGSASDVPLNQWVRIEMMMVSGQPMTIKLFKGADLESTTATITRTAPINLVYTNGSLYIGGTGTNDSAVRYYVDDVAVGTDTWLGPEASNTSVSAELASGTTSGNASAASVGVSAGLAAETATSYSVTGETVASVENFDSLSGTLVDTYNALPLTVGAFKYYGNYFQGNYANPGISASISPTGGRNGTPCLVVQRSAAAVMQELNGVVKGINPFPAGAMSISGRCYFNITGTPTTGLFEVFGSGYNNYGYGWGLRRTSANSLDFSVSNSGYNAPSISITDGSWYRFEFAYDYNTFDTVFALYLGDSTSAIWTTTQSLGQATQALFVTAGYPTNENGNAIPNDMNTLVVKYDDLAMSNTYGLIGPTSSGSSASPVAESTSQTVTSYSPSPSVSSNAQTTSQSVSAYDSTITIAATADAGAGLVTISSLDASTTTAAATNASAESAAGSVAGNDSITSIIINADIASIITTGALDAVTGSALTLNDSLILSTTDSSNISVTGVANDTLAITITDAAVVNSQGTTGDSIDLSVSETAGIRVISGASDTTDVALSESASVHATTITTDVATISVQETADITVYITTTDSLALSVIDSVLIDRINVQQTNKQFGDGTEAGSSFAFRPGRGKIIIGRRSGGN